MKKLLQKIINLFGYKLLKVKSTDATNINDITNYNSSNTFDTNTLLNMSLHNHGFNKELNAIAYLCPE